MRKQSFEVFGRFKSEWMAFAAASIILVALIAYHIFQHHLLIMAQEKEQLLHSAAAAETFIGKQLEEINTTLEKVRAALTQDKELKSVANGTLSDRLEMLASAMPNVQVVAVLDRQGLMTASSDKQLIGQSFAQRDYFRTPAAAPAQEMLYVSEPFTSVYGNWLIGLSKVFFDTDGEFSGVVLIALDAREYSLTLNTLRPTPQAWASLAHGDGLLFAWEPEAMAFIGQDLAKPETLFTRHIESGRTESFFSDTVAANNERSFIAIYTIEPVDLHMNKPLVLGIGRNLDELYQEIQVQALSALAAFIVLVVTGGVTLYMTQRARLMAVSKAEQAEEHLRELSQQLTSFFELTPSLMAITDKKGGGFLRVNPACQKALGYTAEDLKEKSVFEYLHPDDREGTLSAFNDLLTKRSSQPIVVRFRRKDGQYRYLEVSMAVQNDKLFFAALDVTDREIEKEQLHTLAYHDRLTGLPNRALFFDRLHQVIATSSRGKKKAAVMFIDLDGFKAINDTHGHDAGDKVLQTVAQRFAGQVRKADTVARMGGDEFVIILHDVASKNDTVMVARKVLDVVGDAILLDSGEAVRVGASIGISLWPDHGVDMDNLLIAADRAMYQSKKNGKNTFTIVSEDIVDHDGIRFGDEYRVGIDIIDTQHLELAGLVDDITKALRKESKSLEITELIKKLYASTKHHFDTEHEFMEQSAYLDRGTHNEKHQLLLQELKEIGQVFTKEGGVFLVERLHNWLLAHILEEDKKLGSWLASK